MNPERERFLHETDTYRGWTAISTLTGGFRFELALPGGKVASVCQPGELVICPPEVGFSRELLEPSRFFFAEFDPPESEASQRPAHHKPWWPVGLAVVSDRRRLRENLRRLDQWRGLGDLSITRIHSHLLTDVLLLTAQGRERAPSDPLVAQATERLDLTAFSAEMSLAGLAGELGISPSQLTRRFAAVHQVTPVRYVTELRIDRARRMLVGTDRTVASIASTCGYGSAYYFSRAFRRATGQSPSEYRMSGRV